MNSDQIKHFAKLLYDRNYVTSTDGNISTRGDSDNILITRSGSCLGLLDDDDLIEVTLSGEHSENTIPSSELGMHLGIYRTRTDINAIIHAHPTYVITNSLLGFRLNAKILPELLMSMEDVSYTGVLPPSSPRLSARVCDLIEHHSAVILDRHGSITVGESLEEAYFLLERLEFASKITYLTNSSGEVKELTDKEIEEIIDSAKKYNSRLK